MSENTKYLTRAIMWQLKPAVLVIVTAATLVWSAERPNKQRHAKMTRLWRQESGLGSFSDVGTAGGNAIAKPVPLQCTQAGYFPHPGNCNAFYRCVDWTATGKYFSVFRFNCPFGTVFDDDLDICNHPGAVRNPPECAGAAVGLPPPVQPGSSSKPGDDTEPCNGTLAPEPQPVTTTPSGSVSTTGAVTTFTIGTSPAMQSTTLAPGSWEPETTLTPGPWAPETTLVPGPSTESTMAPGSSTEASSVPGFPTGATSVPGFPTGATSVPGYPTGATSVPGFPTEPTTLMPGPGEEDTLPPGLETEGTTLSPGLPVDITPQPTGPSGTEDTQTTPSSTDTTTSGTVWEVDASSIYPCPAPGYYPFEGDCVRFYKCVETDAGLLKGLLYKCPNGFGYSEVKKRCARLEDLPPCLRQPQEAHQRFENATPIYPEDLIWFFNNKK